jgi:hypothetical protein
MRWFDPPAKKSYGSSEERFRTPDSNYSVKKKKKKKKKKYETRRGK